MRVLDQQGNDVLVNGNTGSATTVDINNTNYTIASPDVNLQGVNPNNLTLEELQDAQQKLEQRKKDIESEGTVNQLIYPETIRDLNAVKVATKKLQAKETKPSLQVDTITGNNGWNRQMGKAIASDNETLKDELTQLPLDNLLSQENNLSALKVTSRYIEQGKLENETVQKNFDAINKRIAELEGRPVEQPTPVVEETTPETVAPVVEEKPLTTAEKIFAEPTAPVEPVKKEEEKDVLTEDEMAGFLSTLEDTDAVTKETPVVKDEITQREEAVQQREDDLTFGQGIFRLYDPRSALRTAKEYKLALNAYRRQIADPQVLGRKYLQDVESAYAKRVNQLTNTEFLDNLYIDEQANPLNYIEFERLLEELNNAIFDIKDQATGKLIRKKNQRN